MDNLISTREEKVICHILRHYSFEIISITRARSAYKVETNEGLVCLKKIKHGINKAYNGNLLVEELGQKGFNNTAKYFKTKDGRLQIKYKNYMYYCTEWIDGEECDLNNIDDAIKCMKLLAEFHKAGESIDIGAFKIRNNVKNWPLIFTKALNDLEKYRFIIDRKRLKSQFDTMYYNSIDAFYNRGMTALKYLNQSNYYKISNDAMNKKIVCHDSFYYQNVIKKQEKFYIIDLDSIIFDLKINDLGKVIRRLMFKKAYQWDYSKAKILIDAYSTVNNLSPEEIEIMLCLLIFPHKFWKLGNKRYVKGKKWSESKYTHKLEKMINYNDMQEKFFNAFAEEQKRNLTNIK